MSYGDEVDKERNWITMERMAFHLDEAMWFCKQLDLSGVGRLEQKEWDTRLKNCKDAIEFTRESVLQLIKIIV